MRVCVIFKFIGLCFLFAGVLSSPVFAQGSLGGGNDDIVIFPVGDMQARYNSLNLDVLDEGLVGDHIDLDTGSISFSQMDVSIPGNSALPVQFGRTLSRSSLKTGMMGNYWAPQIPYISRNYTSNQITTPTETYTAFYGKNPDRCTGKLYPQSEEIVAGGEVTSLRAEAYFNGYKIDVPGRNPGTLVQARGGNDVIYSDEFDSTGAYLVSTENWYVDCISSIPAGGEGYKAHAPNGDIYEFTHLVESHVRDFDFNGDTFPVNAETLYVTKITDVHNNWVEFNYDGANLTRIHSKDLREINFSYSDGKLATVTVPATAPTPSRTWKYSYVNNILSRVDLPDNTPENTNDDQYWTFTHVGGDLKAVDAITSREICYKSFPIPDIEIRHPSGAIAQYEFEVIRNGRKDVIFRQELYEQVIAWFDFGSPESLPDDTILDCNNDGDIRSKLPSNFWTIAVTEKRLVLPNGPTYSWQREYEEDEGSYDYAAYNDDDDNVDKVTSWAPYNANLLDTKKRTVIDPEGHKTITYINRTFGREEGQVVKVEIIPSGETSPLKTTEYDYLEGNLVGLSLGARDHGYTGADSTRIYQIESKVSQDGSIFTTQSEFEDDEESAYFAYNQPKSVKTFSDIEGFQAPREQLLTYKHEIASWILSLPETVSEKSGAESREVAKYDYDTLGLGQKVKQFRYEKEIATFGYNSNGTMAWMKDALNRETEAGVWHRGQPQSITKAAHDNSAAITIGQSTNDHGWQMSQTDARGYTTTYLRDIMGRMKRINPSAVDIGKSPTIINYYFGNDEIRQVINKGFERRFVYYDRLYRPIMEKLEVRPKKSTQTALYSITTTQYDGLGRVKFKSLPDDVLNTDDGTEFTYDALGRVLNTSIESGVMSSATSTAYLKDNCTEAKDAETNVTTTCKDGYGGPGGGDIISITQPEGIVTSLGYNGFGELSEVNQTGPGGGDQTQKYFYDDERRLCRSYIPEAGNTLYEYDVAGQMKAYAKGVTGTATSCDSPIGEPTEVKLTYDELGRLKTTEFLDSATPDIWRDYDANGNVTKVYRGQIGGETCQTGTPNVNCWFYEYDEYNRIKIQDLQIDDRSFEMKYYYDGYGYMVRQVLPTGRQVPMYNDGAGRTLSVGWSDELSASGFKYHPNGQIQEFRYGNGLDFDNFQNDLQQLERRWIRASATDSKLDISYLYDGNGRITSQKYNILEGANNNNRTYGYDGAGRLTSADSPSFGGMSTFTYDAIGNLLTKEIRGRTVTNTYDTATNRLTKSVEGTGGPDGAMTRNVGYDDRGNIKTIGGLTFVYDMADQPRTVSGANRTGGSVSGGSYVYDGNLKRVKSVINGVTRYNVYDKDGRLAHVDEGADIATSIQTDYLHAAGMTIARIKDNVFTYMHPDHLGSASAGTDENGTIAFTEFHTPFGEALLNAAANDNQSDFTGHIRDTDIGMSYMQARYYDPNIGRFLSVDPVTFTGARGDPRYFGRYSYSGNDPINNTDPTGRQIRCRSCGLMKWGEFKAAGRGLADGGKLAAGTAADLTPGLGDVKGAVEFAQNPTPIGGAAVVVGMVPLVGDVASGALRQSDNVGDVAEILGNAQQTKSAGELTSHGSTSERIAGEMAETGDYVSVHMNQTVKTITGGDVSSRVRPDVAGVRHDGTVDAIEVLSPRQTSEQMIDKLENALGSSCGAVTCVAPD